MFEHHFGLRENPFVAGHHSRFVYPSPEHQEALAHLRFGIENREPFVLITGEVGTGKTTAIYDALAEWQSRVIVALITNSALTRNELLEEIALRFGISLAGGTSKPQVIVQLERFLLAVHQRGDRAILLLDEAQNLERELLEEIRLLSNLETAGEKLIQVFLVGQPELESKLTRPELRQLRQRITVHYRLSPLSPEDTEHYIHHRIGVAGGHALTIFPSDACAEVYRLTHGIPREINNVCAQALLNAFVEDAQAVSAAHVLTAAADTEFQSVIVRGTEELPGSAPISTAAIETAPMGKFEVRARPPEDAEDDEEELEDLEIESSALPRADAETPTAQAPPRAATGPPMFEEPVYEAPRIEDPPQPPASMPEAPPALAPRPSEDARTAEPDPLSIPAIESWMSSVASERAQMMEGAPEPTTAQPPAAPPRLEPELEIDHGPPPWRPDTTPIPRLPSLTTPAPGPPADESTVRRPEPAVAPAEPAAAPGPGLMSELEAARRAALASPGTVAGEALPRRPSTTARAQASSEPAPAPRRRSLAEEQRASLPPRLRDKLDQEDDFEPSPSGSGLRWLVRGGIVVLVVAILLIRFGPWNAKRPPAPDAVVPIEPPTSSSAIPRDHSADAGATAPLTGSTPAQAQAPVLTPPASGATGGSSRRGASASQTASHAPSTTTRPAPDGSASGSPTMTAPLGTGTNAAARTVASRAAYGIAVGNYLFEDRANTEREKLAASTGLPARVLAVREDGSEVFRLVLGTYPDRAAAERAASDLIRRSLVEEARIVPLPRPAPAKP